MKYLGIDPGTTTIGYGVIEDISGKLRCLSYGAIRNPNGSTVEGKQATVRALQELIATHQPDKAAVEKLFFFRNVTSVMPVSEMRGVILLTLAEHKVPILELTPMQVKQQICGHGRAEKHQVQKMMKAILRLEKDITPDDAADALALALCCSIAPKQY